MNSQKLEDLARYITALNETQQIHGFYVIAVNDVLRLIDQSDETTVCQLAFDDDGNYEAVMA